MENPIKMTYRNYRGQVSDRTIVPKKVWWGSTEWHPEPGWMLTAYDVDKGADRDFALADFCASGQVRSLADLIDALTQQCADLEARAERVEAERDRQYDENVHRIAEQARVEAERDAIAAAWQAAVTIAMEKDQGK